jgi:hypothetical protein
MSTMGAILELWADLAAGRLVRSNKHQQTVYFVSGPFVFSDVVWVYGIVG